MSYQDLPVWQRSVALAEEVYGLAARLPYWERNGLSLQMRRAVVSVSSNIAEGSGRATTADLRNFLSYSRGSVKESESLLIISRRLGFFSQADIRQSLMMTDEISRMITGFRNALRKR